MKFIGLDIETAGDEPAYALQPWRVKDGTARITTISVVTEDDVTIESCLEPSEQDLYALLVRLSNRFPDFVLIGWNTPFDIAWLIAYGFERLVRLFKWADGQVYRRALENHPNPPQGNEWGLKPTVAKYIPEYAGYENEQKGRDWSIVDDTLLKYNRLDAALTARLGRMFWERLSESERVLCNVINSACIPFAATWTNGLTIDTQHLATWEQKVTEEIARATTNLHQQNIEPSALSSPKKLAAILTEKGYDITNAKGKQSVDRTSLSRFKGDSLIDCIAGYKQANTALTKFITGTRKSVEYNGHNTTHPSSRLFNTYTGRVGYSSKVKSNKKEFPVGIAIHQWPRGNVSRNCIVAPQGFLLAECDFATQESRLLADWSYDPTLLRIFRDGLDFHTYMGSRIAGVSYDLLERAVSDGDKEAKNFRQLAKVVNLALAYRTSWRKLIDVARTQYDVILTEQQAQEYHALFRNVYSEVPKYWDEAIQWAKFKGYAETRGARKVYISDWSRARSWSSESTAINFPIQGTGADMKFLGIGCIDPILYREGGRYMLDLHDALLFLVPDTSAGLYLAQRCQRILSNLPYEKVFGWKPQVPMPVGLKLGKAWGSLEEVKD